MGKLQSNLNPMLVAVALLPSLLGPRVAAIADENLFGYVYGSETLPKGNWEFYQWATWRHDRGQGAYDAYDLKTELEYGITDRWQASGYLNFRAHDIQDVPGLEDRNSFSFDGVQLALKYAALSPYKDRLGLAFYVEPGFSRVAKGSGEPISKYTVETKVIAQKNFLDDQLVWAVNLTPEFEWEIKNGEHEKALELEVSTGVSWRFAPNWFVGMEARYASEYGNMNLANLEKWALFLGPSLHWASRKWWATLAVTPQIAGYPDNPTVQSGLNLTSFERLETRLKIGYNF